MSAALANVAVLNKQPVATTVINEYESWVKLWLPPPWYIIQDNEKGSQTKPLIAMQT